MVALTGFTAPLFVPANHPMRFAKAAASGADAIIIDLEDAVPADEKAEARDSLPQAILGLDVPVYVRINSFETPWFAQDVAICSAANIAGIMLPKTQDAISIAQIQKLANHPLPVIAQIETAIGVANLQDISTSEHLVQLAFGSIDYALDLNCSESRDALLLARSQLVFYSRLANLAAPLDGVTTSLDDADLLKDDSLYASSLGFGGKLAIHPKQIAVIKEAFAPTAPQIKWAKQVLKAAEAANGAAVRLNGQMIDQPVIARASRILKTI